MGTLISETITLKTNQRSTTGARKINGPIKSSSQLSNKVKKKSFSMTKINKRTKTTITTSMY